MVHITVRFLNWYRRKWMKRYRILIGGRNARLFNLVINEFNLVKIEKMTKLKLLLSLWHVSELCSTMFFICVILCE
jgi:hypothetical protein